MTELGPGLLRVEILCAAKVDQFSLDATLAVFLSPRPGKPYVFEIETSERDEVPGVVCRR